MTLLLIDGNGIFVPMFAKSEKNPAYRRDGLPTAAIPMFLDRLWWFLGNVGRPQGATHGAVIFDHPSRNWRHEISTSYKANRPPANIDMRAQLRLSKFIAPAFGLKAIDKAGYEADDLIATYARLAEEDGMSTVIVSADKDFMQLVGPRVWLFDPLIKNDRENQILKEPDVVNHFGVLPRQVCDVQALAGDTSDNIAGAPGIGMKIGAELIKRFGDLETLLQNAHEIAQPKRRQSLVDYAEQIRTARLLVELDRYVAVPDDIESMRLQHIDARRVLGSLKALEIFTFNEYFAKAFRLDLDEVEVDEDCAYLADEIMEMRERGRA